MQSKTVKLVKQSRYVKIMVMKITSLTVLLLVGKFGQGNHTDKRLCITCFTRLRFRFREPSDAATALGRVSENGQL